MDFDNRKVYGDTSITDGLVYMNNIFSLSIISYIYLLVTLVTSFMKAIDAFPPEERRPISVPMEIYRVFTLLIFSTLFT